MPVPVFEAMGFPPKVRGAFTKARPRISTIGDLIALTPAEVLKIPGIGPGSLNDIEIILRSQKLSLASRQIGGNTDG